MATPTPPAVADAEPAVVSSEVVAPATMSGAALRAVPVDWLVGGIVAVVSFGLVLLLARGPAPAGLPVSSPGPAREIVQVQLLLSINSAAGPVGSSCTNVDLIGANVPIPGEQLTVSDEAATVVGYAVVPSTGTIVASAAASGGPAASGGSSPGASGSGGGRCAFTMPIGVLDSAGSYSFTVGDITGPTISHGALEAASWTVAFGR